MGMTHDYDQLEREYIASDISIRALCKKHDIKGYSAVAAYSRTHGWNEKREALRARTAARTLEKVADRMSDEEADEIAQFRGESLTVIRAALYKFAEDLKDPSFKVKADELVKLVQLGLLITGSPTERIEERRLDLRATFGDLPADALRGLVEATKPRPSIGTGTGEPSRTSASSTRSN